MEKKLETILNTSWQILSSLNEEEILRRITKTLVEDFGFERAVIFLVNKKDKVIEGKYASGIPEEIVHKIRISTTRKESILLEIMQENKAVLLKNVSENPRLSEVFRQENKCHGGDMALVPIACPAETGTCIGVFEEGAGVIAVDNFSSKREISGEDLVPLKIFAQYAAIAIANAYLHQQVNLLAITDALTGLYNHGYFHQLLKQEIERAERYEKKFSLLMLDIDHFKNYNDTYGHLAGDRLLHHLAEIIRENIRTVDSACRYGGEEFTVILPETDILGAKNLAERIRKSIFEEGEITVSIGIGIYPEDGKITEELINSADKAMYLAKNRGRNLVCLANELKG
ncbi:MAG TPA: hypothetical protein DHV62_08245 [Elusimicrobia bacterium]|jgi:diguanylate cyclase (GGDEF)-like protein|nr:hypothetical protein [Elusimicrobiota bacterium]